MPLSNVVTLNENTNWHLQIKMEKKWIFEGGKEEVKWSGDIYQEAWINNNYNEFQQRAREQK